MIAPAQDIQSFIGKQLHSLLFLEEFTFARTKFSPPQGSEVEFADAVVMLGDVLLIYQMKERLPASAGDAEAERRWFHAKVLGKATKQIRDTLRYLQTVPNIPVPNERGRIFNLAANGFRDVLKIVVYRPSPTLPDDCRRIRHHVSGSAGFIHLIEAHDYLELSRTLRVPEEVVRYFMYREIVLTKAASASGTLPEPTIGGHFIGGDPEKVPSAVSAAHLERLVPDEHEWDIAPMIRGLQNHISVSGFDDGYYEILIEFAKLPRSMWRAVKERIQLSIQKARTGEFARPYRITYPATDCGFVFIPVDGEIRASPDWPAMRLRGLRQLAEAHKYDQRLSKCVAIMVAKDGEDFDIIWCLVSYPWQENAEFQQALDESFPFRPVSEKEVHGYRLVMDEDPAG